jgi:hypothetical protein
MIIVAGLAAHRLGKQLPGRRTAADQANGDSVRAQQRATHDLGGKDRSEIVHVSSHIVWATG